MKTEVMTLLNENLKKLRKQKGYTQEEIASRLHVVRQTVSKWEKGVSVPDADTVSRLAEIYEVNVSDLLGTVTLPEGRVDTIAQELEKINRQMAARNRSVRTFWNILTALGILVLLWGLSGIGLGAMNYSAAVRDPAYSPETLHMVLSGCVSAVTKGGIRTVTGLGIILISRFMSRSLV